MVRNPLKARPTLVLISLLLMADLATVGYSRRVAEPGCVSRERQRRRWRWLAAGQRLLLAQPVIFFSVRATPR
uniref:Uncharacterized protein n=1 Tax=Zea mays TaxID=4577 RepID=B6TYL6_MAIZE|nr:hypothetical protein [Zea mays]